MALVACPHCERKLKVTPATAGKMLRCPGCGATFRAGVLADDVDDSRAIATDPTPRDVVPAETGVQPPRARRVDDQDERRRDRRWRPAEPEKSNAGLVIALIASGLAALVAVAAILYVWDFAGPDVAGPDVAGPNFAGPDPGGPVFAPAAPPPQPQPAANEDIAAPEPEKNEKALAEEAERNEEPEAKLAVDPAGCRLLSHGRSRLRSFAFSRGDKSLLVLSASGNFSDWDLATLEARKTGHLGTVEPLTACDVSADGKLAAGVCANGDVLLFDLTTGAPTLLAEEAASEFACVSLSPDGAMLATVHGDNAVKVWDVAQRKLKHTVGGFRDAVGAVKFSPDGSLLAGGTSENAVHLCDAATGAEKAVLRGTPYAHFAPGKIWALAFSPDGTELAAGSSDDTARLWDLKTRKQRALLPRVSQGGVNRLAFSSDAKLLAVTGVGDVSLWSVDHGELLGSFRCQRAFAWQLNVAFSPRDRFIAVMSDNTLQLWSMDELNQKHPQFAKARVLPPANVNPKDGRSIPAHSGPVKAVFFSPPGKRLLSASLDGSAKWWDLDRGRLLETLPHGVARMSANGRWLIVRGRDGKLALHDLEKGNVNESAVVYFSVSSWRELAISPDGQRVLLADDRHGLKMYRLPGFEPDGEWKFDGAVSQVAFSADGKRFAVCVRFSLQPLRIFDVAGRQELVRCDSRGIGENHDLVFSPDGKRLLAGGKEGALLRIFNADNGRPVANFATGQEIVTGIAVHPQGDVVATAGVHGSVVLWDLTSNDKLVELQAKPWDAQVLPSVAFSADGKLLAAGGHKTITLWDVEAVVPKQRPAKDAKPGAQTPVLGKAGPPADKLGTPRDGWSTSGHDGDVKYLCFTPDGSTALSYGADGTLKRWDVKSGRLVESVASKRNGPVRPTPDGKFVFLVETSAKHLVLKDLETGELRPTVIPHEVHSWDAVSVSPDGKLALVADFARWLKKDNAKLQLFRLPSLQLETDWPFDKPVQQVVFSPDGKRFAVFVKSSPKPLRVYDVATHQEIASCQQDKLDANRVLTFSPDGRRLYSGGEPAGAVSVWDADTGKLLDTLATEQKFISSLAIQPGGAVAATGGSRGIVCLWDLKTKTRLAWMQVNMKDPKTANRSEQAPGPVVAFSADGKTLAAGGYQAITFWDVERVLRDAKDNPERYPPPPKEAPAKGKPKAKKK